MTFEDPYTSSTSAELTCGTLGVSSTYVEFTFGGPIIHSTCVELTCKDCGLSSTSVELTFEDPLHEFNMRCIHI